MRQEARLERFVQGWNPHNLPPTYLNPRELREGQVLDARNLRATPGGTLFWDRNQFIIHSPVTIAVKCLVDFTTDDYSQLLVFGYDTNSFDAVMYRLSTNWATLTTPSIWAYGYELFENETWANITSESEAVAALNIQGIMAAAQSRESLLICPTAGAPVLEWDGATLRIVGLDAPPIAPTSGGTAAGDLSAGTYSYYYTYYESATGYESMPSAILDVHCASDGNKITVTGITDYGDGYHKRLYRAYSEDYAADARGSEFYLVTTLPPGSVDAGNENLTTWTEVDTEGRLTVAANQLDATALEEDDTCYVYSDEGADAIGDFEHRCSLNITSMADHCNTVVLGSTNTLATFGSWAAGLAVEVLRDDTYSPKLLLCLRDVGGNHFQWGGLSTATTYYLKLRRAGDRAYLEVYTTSDYSGEPLYAMEIACATTAYRYVMAACAYGGAGMEAATYRITDVQLAQSTTFVDEVAEYALGESIAFDHALPPRGSIMAYHKERMFIAGAAEGSRSYPGYDEGYWGNVLFWSELDEPHYWPGANLLAVGDDAPIIELVSWGEFLVVFKRNGLWAVTGWTNDDFIATQQPDLPGCVGYGAYAAGPPGVVWLAADGYYFWDGAQARLLVEISDETPWAVLPNAKAPSLCAYHDGRYYMAQANGWIEWSPATDQFAYHEAAFADDDGQRAGFVAVARGAKQTHLLTRMLWATGGDQEITVLDPLWPYPNHATEGSSYSDLYAPVQVTLPPLDAPPGYMIVPLELWVAGTWVDHAEAAKHVKAVLNADADYSVVAGDNAWATTPDAPQEGEMLGIPVSYEYGAGSAKTNAARRWYIQLTGLYAKDFRLEAVTVRYLLRRAAG